MKIPEKNETHKSKIIEKIKYFIGSAIVFSVAIKTIPKILQYTSSTIYKRSVTSSNQKRNQDDWGPVIEKKK